MVNQPISLKLHQVLSGRTLWWLQQCQPPSLGCRSCSRLRGHEWCSPTTVLPRQQSWGAEVPVHRLNQKEGLRNETHLSQVRKPLPENANAQLRLPALSQAAAGSRTGHRPKGLALQIRGHVNQALKDHAYLGQ